MAKKRFVVVVVVVALVILIVCVLASLVNRYTLEATVIDTQNNIVTIEDETGNVWEFEDTEQWYEMGERVKVVWNDKGTDFKQDDEIIKVVAQ